MPRAAAFWLAMIRSPFCSPEFFTINRDQLAALAPDEKRALWARLTDDERQQIKGAQR